MSKLIYTGIPLSQLEQRTDIEPIYLFERMKIGILTLHNNRNKGSLLQNYCLVKTIQDILPAVTVETIDYRCRSHEFKRYKNALVTKQVEAIPARVRDFRRTERFMREYCNLSDSRLISDSYEKTISFLNENEYDIVMFGSDTIWKVTTGYDRSLSGQRPFPNVYFGGSDLSAQKIAYAASANKTDVTRFTKTERQFIRESLNDFSAIGVRDSHTEDLLRRLEIDAFERVPDPTFLCDIPTPELPAETYRTSRKEAVPLLGVNIPKNEIASRLIDQFKSRGYEVIAPTDSPYADLDLVGTLSPFEYYRLHAEFDFTITNSLHSTIFSLHNETPFLTIDIDKSYEQLPSKTESLLAEFDLLSRHVPVETIDLEDDLETYLELQAAERERIRATLESHRDRGQTFLRQALTETMDQ